MDTENRKFTIIDYADDPDYKPEEPPPPLPDSFGYSLDTIEKARQWLTHPQNWFKSTLFIIRWDGLVPRISESRARRMIVDAWDDSLAEFIVLEQRNRRSKRDRGESVDDRESPEEPTVD